MGVKNARAIVVRGRDGGIFSTRLPGVCRVLICSLNQKMRKFPYHRNPYLRTVASWLCLVAMHCAQAASPAQAPGLMVSKDGSFVFDPHSRLAWARCVEGMQWSGQSCTGEPKQVNFAEARALAIARAKADDACWRVPGVKELQHLVGNGEASAQGGEALFPSAPPDWYWTASVSIDSRSVNPYDYKNIQKGVTEQNANRLAFLHGWVVNVQTGEARGGVLRSTKLPVRLVCTVK
jgi:hypothetical protein